MIRSNYVTYLLSFTSARNRIKYKKNIYEMLYNTFVEFYSIQEQILMYEGSFQLLYYPFSDFWSRQEHDFKVPPFSKITLSHIFWVLYWSGKYLIRKDIFLTAYLNVILVLKWSGKYFYISVFFITVPLLIFKDL